LLSEKFDVGKNEKINISEYKTIGSIIELVKGSFKKEEPSFEDAKGEVRLLKASMMKTLIFKRIFAFRYRFLWKKKQKAKILT